MIIDDAAGPPLGKISPADEGSIALQSYYDHPVMRRAVELIKSRQVDKSRSSDDEVDAAYGYQ